MVYIHVGKTGGTSLRSMLVDTLGPSVCSEPFVQNYMTENEADRYRVFPVICGHISRADQLKWFPDRRVITVLREPNDRCLSFIHYVRSLAPDAAPVAADAHRLAVTDLIETEEAQRNLNNTMVRQLGGHMLDAPVDFPALLEQAKSTLREAFWVGRQNTMAADIERLGTLLGHRINLDHKNVTEARPPIHDEDPRVISRLYALNDYDFQLWAWWEREVQRRERDQVIHQ